MTDIPARRPRRWLVRTLLVVAVVVAGLVTAFWGDLVSTNLDPKVPFQTYSPPPAPDYARQDAWYLRPAAMDARDVDVFFIGPTTYSGGRNWNARINHPKAVRQFREVMAPNYLGPFVGIGRVFAPRYRQASLYSLTTLREDAREARQFAYGDVKAAFDRYLAQDNGGRGILIVGIEQGGVMALRLLHDKFFDPELKARLVAAYLVETAVSADKPPILPCVMRNEAGCLAAWISVRDTRFETAKPLLDRALVWNDAGVLENLSPRPALCFNPVLGATTETAAPARLHLGAADATGLEWDARPAFLTRQVTTRCEGGVLRVSRPKSSSLSPSGSWANRRKVPGFNLFYADLEADAKARLAAWRAR